MEYLPENYDDAVEAWDRLGEEWQNHVRGYCWCLGKPQKGRPRKGFVEVSTNIHHGLINLEAWSVHPNFDIQNRELAEDKFPDEVITGNTEIELSIVEAKKLVDLLQSA